MDVKNEAFLPLFDEVKEMLAPYAQHLTVRRDEPGYYDLWSEKDIVIDGRRRREVFFCGLIIQKGHVGFYFMPLYADQERSLVFGPDLLAKLKGESCFHLREMTPDLRRQLRDALAAGWRLYEERGWV
jgi:hypothetical protein